MYILLSTVNWGAIFFFFQAEDGIRDSSVTGVQTCALPISALHRDAPAARAAESGDLRASAPPGVPTPAGRRASRRARHAAAVAPDPRGESPSLGVPRQWPRSRLCMVRRRVS